MLDEQLRHSAKRVYRPLVAVLARLGVTANGLTFFGLLIGVGCLVATAQGHNLLGLSLWLLNRLVDGLDGEVARARDEAGDRGTFWDLNADFFMYGGLVVALAVQHEHARLPLVVLLGTYYLNGSVFLCLSSLLERRGAERGSERGLHFHRSLTEGFETIVYGTVVLAWPATVVPATWVFAGMVAVSVVQRGLDGHRILSD